MRNGFLSDVRGSMITLTAIAAPVMILAIACGIDYSRAVNVKRDLQNAADAAVLALARVPNTTDAQFQTDAQRLFNTNIPKDVKVEGFTAVRANRKITLEAHTSVPTSMLHIFSLRTFEVNARSTAEWSENKVEVALVLDNTGSMDQWPKGVHKLTALKGAAKGLVDVLAATAYDSNAVKIGLVPFAKRVRVDPIANPAPSWVDFSVNSNVSAKTWTGCIEDRNQPYDVQDGATSQLYPATKDCDSLQPIRALANDFANIKLAIDGLVASGTTNVTIGVAWGMALLSSGVPFTQAAPASDKETKKFMVVLTDGDNTANRWSGKASEINKRTEEACSAAKNAGYTVYTIRLIDGSKSLLEKCATSKSHYFDVQDASKLNDVFKEIAQQIAILRITS